MNCTFLRPETFHFKYFRSCTEWAHTTVVRNTPFVSFLENGEHDGFLLALGKNTLRSELLMFDHSGPQIAEEHSTRTFGGIPSYPGAPECFNLLIAFRTYWSLNSRIFKKTWHGLIIALQNALENCLANRLQIP